MDLTFRTFVTYYPFFHVKILIVSKHSFNPLNESVGIIKKPVN